MIKECSKCCEVKPPSEFSRDKGKLDGLRTVCKSCSAEAKRIKRAALGEEEMEKLRERSRQWRRDNPERSKYIVRDATLRHKYGIGIEEYDALLEEQGGVCAICKRPDPRGTRANVNLHVDHDHDTGEVRGLLCRPCNSGMGFLQEDISIMQAAINYLSGESK